MQDAADHAPVVDPILAPNVRRQKRRDPLPLLVAQPKQVASHAPSSYPSAENHYPIHPSSDLLSSDPSL
jgi:hypothetical protein